METVRRLSCNWKRIDDGYLIGTVEYAPMELMHRASCCGEVRLCRLVSLGIASLGKLRGVIDDDRLFNPLPPVASSPSTLLPANFQRGQREGGGRGAGEKEGGGEGANRLCRRCVPRVCRELFQGRYFPALSSLICLRILLGYVLITV